MITFCSCNGQKKKDGGLLQTSGFTEINRPTPNVGRGKNEVRGVVLHQTACSSAKSAVGIMTNPNRRSRVSAHVVIDRDGSRYILASPEKITWHAGRSRFQGRNYCNNFTIGIEFQGFAGKDTLTHEQICSAIEYIRPLMKKYHFSTGDITTHHLVRESWNKHYPKRNTWDKDDITDQEYDRFMKALEDSIDSIAS